MHQAKRGDGKARVRWEPHEIARWLERRKRHGWTWSELTRISGVPRATLQWWKRRLASAEVKSQPQSHHGLDFVAKRIAIAHAPQDQGSRSVRPQCLLELPSGHRLTVEEGFSQLALRELLAVLQES